MCHLGASSGKAGLLMGTQKRGTAGQAEDPLCLVSRDSYGAEHWKHTLPSDLQPTRSFYLCVTMGMMMMMMKMKQLPVLGDCCED